MCYEKLDASPSVFSVLKNTRSSHAEGALGCGTATAAVGDGHDIGAGLGGEVGEEFAEFCFSAVDAHFDEAVGGIGFAGDFRDGEFRDLEEGVGFAKEGGKLVEGGLDTLADVVHVGGGGRGCFDGSFGKGLVGVDDALIIAEMIFAQVSRNGEDESCDGGIIILE